MEKKENPLLKKKKKKDFMELERKVQYISAFTNA